jgi:hypothetical protein
MIKMVICSCNKTRARALLEVGSALCLSELKTLLGYVSSYSMKQQASSIYDSTYA